MFWDSLQSPIIGLSPMDGVTDAAMRYITKKYGNPSILLTEFTSVEGICHGATKLLHDFSFQEIERPIIAQVFGSTPESFRPVATLLCFLGFDGIDINMGCPANTVAQRGGGAALILDPKRARNIIKQTKLGVKDWQEGVSLKKLPFTEEILRIVKTRHDLLPKSYKDRTRVIPVSVKTRIGYDHPVIEEWVSHLLEEHPVTISIHGRTLKQLYAGKADWEEIAKAVPLGKQAGTRILGNGDLRTRNEALEKIKQYGLNGVLIGQGAMGNPWVFLEQQPVITWEDRKRVMIDHVEMYMKLFPGNWFLPMRKHLGWYVKSMPNASEIRQELYATNNLEQVKNVLTKW